jgi:peptide/nickel transport system permease protein
MKTGNRLGMFLGLTVLLLAVVGPLISLDPLAQPDPVAGMLMAPSMSHWLGTDQFSRDVFARLAHGARISLMIATIAVGISASLGILIGVLGGGSAGVMGRTFSRITDLALALPRVVVLLVVVATLGRVEPVSLGVVLGLTGWPGIARLVRGEAIRLRGAAHVSAAIALGASPKRVLAREILPGTLPPALVAATLGVADVVLLEAGLGFLGIGVSPVVPTWGSMILQAQSQLSNAPWLLLAPGVALVVTTAAATLLGDTLRSRLSPGSS